MFPVPRWIRTLSLVISGAVLLSALGAAVLALLSPAISAGSQVSWPLVGFEAVVALAAVMGVLFGVGRYAQAPGLALACVAGTIFVGSGLAWQASGRTLVGHSLTPLLLARVGSAALLGLCACVCVLGRDPRSWRTAALGAALACPGSLLALSLASDVGRRTLEGALGRIPALQTTIEIAGAIVLGAMFAAGGHLLIRAFEMGRTEAEAAPPGVTSSRSA